MYSIEDVHICTCTCIYMVYYMCGHIQCMRAGHETMDACTLTVSSSGCIPVEVERRMWRVLLSVSSSSGLHGMN